MFFPVSDLHPKLKHAGKAGAFKWLHCKGSMQNLDSGGSDLKHSSLLQYGINYGRKQCNGKSPGPNIIKLFTDVIYEFS